MVLNLNIFGTDPKPPGPHTQLTSSSEPVCPGSWSTPLGAEPVNGRVPADGHTPRCSGEKWKAFVRQVRRVGRAEEPHASLVWKGGAGPTPERNRTSGAGIPLRDFKNRAGRENSFPVDSLKCWKFALFFAWNVLLSILK